MNKEADNLYNALEARYGKEFTGLFPREYYRRLFDEDVEVVSQGKNLKLTPNIFQYIINGSAVLFKLQDLLSITDREIFKAVRKEYNGLTKEFKSKSTTLFYREIETSNDKGERIVISVKIYPNKIGKDRMITSVEIVNTVDGIDFVERRDFITLELPIKYDVMGLAVKGMAQYV